MPCYLFTFHAHGSWLPDHPRGFVKRGQGIQPQNHRLAARYGEQLQRRVAVFDAAIQRQLITSAIDACTWQECRCHAIATDRTHLHVLVSWASDRTWQTVRRQLGGRASRDLNQLVERRPWFAKSPSRKQVKDQRHFDYLVSKYLPDHRGLKWDERRGIYA